MSMLANVTRLSSSDALNALFVVVINDNRRVDPQVKLRKGPEQAMATARDVLLASGTTYGHAHIYMGEKRYAKLYLCDGEMEVTQIFTL